MTLPQRVRKKDPPPMGVGMVLAGGFSLGDPARAYQFEPATRGRTTRRTGKDSRPLDENRETPHAACRLPRGVGLFNSKGHRHGWSHRSK
jgi:hypothetical protein